MFDHVETFAKLLAGKEVTDEDKTSLREHSARYELVRFLYMEKMKADGMPLSDFHFTPGPKWTEVPIIDIINDLLEFNKAISDGNVKPIKFDDAKLVKHGPPHTGMEKVNISDL